METTIQNDILVKTLQQHLKGKTREAVNFTYTADLIKVQSSSDFILDTYIIGEYPNELVGTSFSIVITNAIQLLRDDKGITTITQHGGEVVIFEQEDITIPFNIAYDERIEIEWKSIEKPGKVSVREFHDISKGFRNLINISKSLEVGVPPIMIISGKVYCVYSNTIFIGNIPMVFPDLEIPYNTFNNLSKSISGSSVNLLVDSIKKIMLMQIGIESAATTTYKKPNLEIITSIEKRISELTYVGNININIMSTLELLFKCFPKETVTLSVYEDDTLGIMFSVTNGRSIRAGVKDMLTKFNISINTTQFDSIFKTFKEASNVDVYKGRDIVCLKGLNNKTLLLSGMTF